MSVRVWVLGATGVQPPRAHLRERGCRLCGGDKAGAGAAGGGLELLGDLEAEPAVPGGASPPTTPSHRYITLVTAGAGTAEWGGTVY